MDMMLINDECFRDYVKTFALFQMLISGSLVEVIYDRLGFHETIIKAFVNAILFFGFWIQRQWVFRKKKKV